MKIPFVAFCLAVSCRLATGQNPIARPGVYIADPSARVWDDGNLYVYGSLDESTSHYCSERYHVLSTSDLMSWKTAENAFSSTGENDQVDYSDAVLYAPDCQYKNGKYYLYYCQPERNAAEGVAVGDAPNGPFKGGRRIPLAGIEEIDPAVFIDDDGQAYYIWGQFRAKVAKLRPNMTEIDPSTIVNDIVTESAHHFHEGSFMVKRKGIYYLVYADVSRGSRPTCLGYSTSDSPMGPFNYGGVIIDNDHCDPGNWNNHGSIVEYRGQWYVFYHRSTHGSRMMRKACVEPISFNDDGSIDEVEMTSQGAGPPLDAFETIGAERACLLFGNSRIELFERGTEKIAGIENGDSVAYKYVDFKKGASEVELRIRPLENGGILVVRLDQPWGPIVAVVAVSGEENADWKTVGCKMKHAEGIHAVWLSFHGKNDRMLELDSFSFRRLE